MKRKKKVSNTMLEIINRLKLNIYYLESKIPNGMPNDDDEKLLFLRNELIRLENKYT